MKTRLLNFTLYEVGWFACVLGAASGSPRAGTAIAIALTALHITLAVERGRELLLILLAGLLGLTLEAALLPLGVLRFEAHSSTALLPPLWIVVLWLQFATLLHYGLSWLAGRPLLAAGAGFLGGPLAFLAGERLGAAAIGEPRLLSLALLATVWGLGLPVLFTLADRLGGSDAGRYRLWPEGERSAEGEAGRSEPRRLPS